MASFCHLPAVGRLFVLSSVLIATSTCGDGAVDPGDDPPDPSAAAPAAPTGLQVSTVSPTSVRLTWQDNAGNETGYRIYRGTTAGSLALVETEDANVETCDDAGLAPATTYFYQVAAFNSHGESRSGTGSVTTSSAILVNVPLQLGQQWRYAMADTSTVSAVSTGTSQTTFVGERIVRVTRDTTLGGRPTQRLTFYDFNGTPSRYRPAFQEQHEFVSLGTDGLWRYVNGWRRLVSFQTATVDPGEFLMQSAAKGDDILLSASTVTVPAGAYATVRAFHESHEYGQYATEHWDVRQEEHWGDQVGLVLSKWYLNFDDRDAFHGTDVNKRGSAALTHVNTGPFPSWVTDTEANDTTTASQPLTPTGAVVDGTVHIGDGGAVMTNAAIGSCGDCVAADESGVRRLQDWYELVLTGSRIVTVDLYWSMWDPSSASYNDLDLYVFRQSTTGISFIGASTNPATDEYSAPLYERFYQTLTRGTYYVAIQAWSTRGAPAAYALSVR